MRKSHRTARKHFKTTEEVIYMKNPITRVLSLLVALLVLVAPIGAMADETPSITLALSNPSMSVGDELSLNLGITAQLDLAGDFENGTIDGTLTLLAGDAKAAKAGFTFDLADMNLVAGLEGMTDAVVIPMADMLAEIEDQMADAFSGEGMESIISLFGNYSDLMSVFSENGEELNAAIDEKINAWMEKVLADGYKGATTVTVEGEELAAEQYDFELTIQEYMAFCAEIIDVVKSNPELVQAIQAYIDTVIAMSGEEIDDETRAMLDFENFDFNEILPLFEDIDMTCSGSLYLIDEESFVLDLNLSSNEEDAAFFIPTEFIVLSDEESSYIAFNMNMDQDGETVVLSIEADVPKDETPKFSIAVNGSTLDEDGDGEEVLFSLTADCTDGADISLYGEVTSSYSYGEDSYTSLSAIGLNYAGETIADEKGVSYPGKLSLYVNQDGEEIEISLDTLFALNNESTVSFEMPHNLINIEEADEDTMNSLSEEFTEVLSNSMMILMSAPGMQDLMAMMGGSDY